MNRYWKGTAYLAATLSLAVLSGCRHKQKPDSTTASGDVCTEIQGCVATSGGFQFPDGNGGTVVCTNGVCKDNNPNGFDAGYNAGYIAGLQDSGAYKQGYDQGFSDGSASGYQTGYNDGYSDGDTDGYNSGYADGSAAGNTVAYNQGYADGSTDGYNSGYADGSADGYNSGYADGNTDGYNSGWNDGYVSGNADGYNSGVTDGYNSGYTDGTNDGYTGGWNDGYNSGYSDGFSDGSSSFSSNTLAGHTHDVDLQRAELQKKILNSRAQEIANQFQMSFHSAIQLTMLADQVTKLSVKGKLTAEDRLAVTKSALGIAGISTDEVNHAILESVKGDDQAADDLMEKAAQNLGMSSSATLRDKLLPALGIQLN